MSVDVSIVLPVYNESGHLAAELSRIQSAMDRSGLSYEIIVVDDGSSDGSSGELADFDQIRLIRFSKNLGSGTARRVGTSLASGAVVVWTDADMTYPNDRIPDLVSNLAGYDMVIGARKGETGSHRMLRVPAKWLIRLLASFLTRTRIPDLNSGFRAFRRVVAEQYLHLLPAGFSGVTTLTMSFLSNGYLVRYVPIDYAPRSGRSKFHWWRDTTAYLRQVIRMVLMWNPLRFFGPLAAVTGTISSVKLAYDLLTKDFRIATNTVFLLLCTAAVILLALVADLVGQLSRPSRLVPPALSDSIDGDATDHYATDDISTDDDSPDHNSSYDNRK